MRETPSTSASEISRTGRLIHRGALLLIAGTAFLCACYAYNIHDSSYSYRVVDDYYTLRELSHKLPNPAYPWLRLSAGFWDLASMTSLPFAWAALKRRYYIFGWAKTMGLLLVTGSLALLASGIGRWPFQPTMAIGIGWLAFWKCAELSSLKAIWCRD